MVATGEELKRGSLSSYFRGVGAKRVSAHEVDPAVSRGHEFQGVKDFQRFIGPPSEKRKLDATYLWLGDDGVSEQITSTVTWYDSRRGKSHREAEGRFYYPADVESVVRRARDGDTLFVCLHADGRLLFVLTPAASSTEAQLKWLFGLSPDANLLNLTDVDSSARFDLGFAGNYILEEMGFELEETDDSFLEKLVSAFGLSFPGTAKFSAKARELAKPVDLQRDPDDALMTWIDHEYRLFRLFERHLIAERVGSGFTRDGVVNVDEFLSFSMSVQQRRKARAGYSLENHLKHLFSERQLEFQHGAKTEGRKTPDFLFPGAAAYQDETYPAEALTLLGAKSTCKDRWRQVLSEGDRVAAKHLLTIEPSISKSQTDEMQSAQLTLIIPRSLHNTYSPMQRGWLLDLSQFIELVESRAQSVARLAH